jgi:hypothetical protein
MKKKGIFEHIAARVLCFPFHEPLHLQPMVHTEVVAGVERIQTGPVASLKLVYGIKCSGILHANHLLMG